ncbi:MAG: metallophosphoesterase family protein [Paludibacteraceae bacterium]|nr:metallophosphoesterase family protein [Paludibacteraceae bacterium]
MSRAAKISLSVVAVILVVAAAIVCALRWKAWFGNQPEQPYSVPAVPHNIVLSYGEKTQSTRIVSFRCDTVTAPACVELLNWTTRDTLVFPAHGTIVSSRAGKAAFYRAVLDSVIAGNYSYRCIAAGHASQWYNLYFADRASQNNMQQFLVFGDIQDKQGAASSALFNTAFSAQVLGNALPAAMVFVGDIIERPTDHYWQLFFNSLGDRQTVTPVIAATGNHEYLKGIHKTLDRRWTHVFGNPGNGPERFSETTYFLDFPYARIIVLDTDALQSVPDYTIMQTWLRMVLARRPEVWKIIVMHHPLFSASSNRSNTLLRLAFQRIFEQSDIKADLVFAGHDHNYMRTAAQSGKPVYILTNSSDKFYPPKEDLHADSHAAYMRVFEDVKVYRDSIRVNTWNADADTVFDSVVLSRYESRQM